MDRVGSWLGIGHSCEMFEGFTDPSEKAASSTVSKSVQTLLSSDAMVRHFLMSLWLVGLEGGGWATVIHKLGTNHN